MKEGVKCGFLWACRTSDHTTESLLGVAFQGQKILHRLEVKPARTKQVSLASWAGGSERNTNQSQLMKYSCMRNMLSTGHTAAGVGTSHSVGFHCQAASA